MSDFFFTLKYIIYLSNNLSKLYIYIFFSLLINLVMNIKFLAGFAFYLRLAPNNSESFINAE